MGASFGESGPGLDAQDPPIPGPKLPPPSYIPPPDSVDLLRKITLKFSGRPQCGEVHAAGGDDVAHAERARHVRRPFLQERAVSFPVSSSKVAIQLSSLVFSYVIKGSICALSVCEEKFARNTTFAFLTDIAKAFLKQNGARVDVVATPYYFFEFGTRYCTSTGSSATSVSRRSLPLGGPAELHRFHMTILGSTWPRKASTRRPMILLYVRINDPNPSPFRQVHRRSEAQARGAGGEHQTPGLVADHGLQHQEGRPTRYCFTWK